jgi:hypothetical protein
MCCKSANTPTNTARSAELKAITDAPAILVLFIDQNSGSRPAKETREKTED